MTTPPNGLLSLPRELREHVYTHLVDKRHNIITMCKAHRHRASEISAAQPAISRVNKQLRAEVLPLFYARNTFFANLSLREELEMTKKWLHGVGDANLGCLRSLILQGTSVLYTYGGCRGSYSRCQVNFAVQVSFDLMRGEPRVERESEASRAEESGKMRKALGKLREFYHGMVEERKREGKEFGVESLSGLVGVFHELCWDDYLGESPTEWAND